MDRRNFIKYSAIACIGAGIACGASRFIIKPKTNEIGELIEPDDALLFTLQFHLAEHCNLNCKYCCHFSCIAEKEFLNIHKFKKDIKRLAELTESKIHVINLLGGEPLLNANCAEYIKITRKYFPKSYLLLTTNGILLTKMNDNLWKTIHDNYTILNVTYYPIEYDKDKIMSKVKDFNLLYNEYYVDKFIKLDLQLDGSNDYVSSWTKCPTKNRCAFVYDGKYFACEIPANIHHFNKKFNKNLEVCEDDYLDIYKVKSFKEFEEYSNKPTPFCRYCNCFAECLDYGIPLEEVKWENSSEHDISEWTNQVDK